MRAVWKYPLPATDVFVVSIPQGAELLSTQMQHGEACLWALVDVDAPPVERQFRLAGTGHVIKQDSLKFVATIQLHGGSLVFHLFEILRNDHSTNPNDA